MEGKGRGIIIRSVMYGDNGLIVTVLSRSNGLMTFFVKGVFSKNSKFRPALLQCMNIVDFVVAGRTTEGKMAYLKELSIAHLFKEIPFDMTKSSVVFYLCDIVSASIIENEPNEQLYDFVEQTLMWLDLVDTNYNNLPVFFTLELSRYLGFYPNTSNYAPGSIFDMVNGCFKPYSPDHPNYLDAETSQALNTLSRTPIAELSRLTFNNAQRRHLLDGLLAYYKIHIAGFREIKSHEVLRQILI